MFPEARSCRSASLRLMFLKNHLGKGVGAEGTAPLGFWGVLQAPDQTSDPVWTQLDPYSRLRFQAVHQGHEVVGDQPLLARGERLRLPPLAVPAGTQRSETLPGSPWDPHRLPEPPGTPLESLTPPGHGASPPSAAPGPRRGWAGSCTGPPPAYLGDKWKDKVAVATSGVSKPPHTTGRPHLAWGSMEVTRARRTPEGLEPRSRCGSASARGQEPP